MFLFIQRLFLLAGRFWTCGYLCFGAKTVTLAQNIFTKEYSVIAVINRQKGALVYLFQLSRPVSKDFTKGLLAGFVLSLLTLYSFFRIYWIMEIGVKYFRWHAVLWLYLFILFLFTLGSYFLYKRGMLKSLRGQKIYMVVCGLVAGLYVAEIYLRLAGDLTTYSEHREGVFVNPAERTQKTWYMTGRPNQIKTLASGSEYSFNRHANSLGFSDKEWTTQKDTNEVRIITLGDSFTEGDGAEADSSYPSLLQGMLQNRLPQLKINVMNAGMCGSDPWFEYKKLHDLLLKYQPDIVLYTNGSNDLLFDHLIYGGMERFAADSSVKNRIPHHSWLDLYEVSYVFRLILNYAGYDHTLFSIADREKNAVQAIKDSKLLSQQFSRLAAENNFQCIELIRPDKSEVETNNLQFNLKELLADSDTLTNYTSCNLLHFYADSLHITEDNVDDYFWKMDQHHNAQGYEAMAKAAYSCVYPMLNRK